MPIQPAVAGEMSPLSSIDGTVVDVVESCADAPGAASHEAGERCQHDGDPDRRSHDPAYDSPSAYLRISASRVAWSG